MPGILCGFWVRQTLIKMAEQIGQDQMAENFRQALVDEDVHLAHVRQWTEAAAMRARRADAGAK
jgi:ferritin-like metal-binding protein YciE